MFAPRYFPASYFARYYFAGGSGGAGVVIASAAGSIVSRACTVAFAWRGSTATLVTGGA